MFSFLRASGPPRTNNASHNPVIYDQGRAKLQFNGSGSEYIMTHTIPPTTVEFAALGHKPPLHYHTYQEERFLIRSGSSHFYLGLDSKPFVTKSAGSKDPTVVIPVGRYHTFENASKTEDLVVDITLDPASYELEQRFFRNFMGYVDDCRKTQSEPSFFQMMVFLHGMDIPLAVPWPNETIGKWLSWGFTAGAAFIGSWVLGYKVSYPEYYEGPKSK